ncbi:response regulator transcription factor [Nocardioides albus]|uniref:DNA-binding NarL/FixJ family response regulator n=1 Tax=Nocardioides albus TaxID=1841 RepID=A0A7W5F6V4_9ACTN|nr:response regulator transcription factor [Nocardioides albus]MBB3087177.1 DNA-binding NarL/FixJ family response regulator [Nocardioides albus]GGU07178.1 DNA-binding response regulator [Nocardioides albus]
MVSPRKRLKVVLVDDHTLFAESLEMALTFEGYDARRIDLPEEPPSEARLASLIMRSQPRIVLLDLDLGQHGSGVRLIAPLARAGADVVVVTSSTDEARWGHALHAGARTVLSKTVPLGEILGTVRRLNYGLSVLDVEDRERWIRAWAGQEKAVIESRRRLAELSPRESQVLELLMNGSTVGEIAKIRVVAEATVRTQVKSILAKLGVSSQIAAVSIAHKAEWRAT